MQSDLLAHLQKDFIELARRAGCFQVFLGMESLDAEALAGAGKRQNRIADYAATVRAWQDAGIFVHAGYIVGFPHDTMESVRESVRRLRDEIGVDVASFFLLTPLAGSSDHTAALAAGVDIDEDLNRHDTFHAVTDPGGMSRTDAEAAYHAAWREFYSLRASSAPARGMAGRSASNPLAELFMVQLCHASRALPSDDDRLCATQAAEGSASRPCDRESPEASRPAST